MNNEKNTRLEEEINSTNAEEMAEELEEFDPLQRKPAPVMEYGTPLIIFVNRVIKHRKPRIIKSMSEHEPDKVAYSTYYEIKYKILDTEYGTKSEEKTSTLFEEKFNQLNRAMLVHNTKAVSAVFSAEPYEYAEKDKESGQPTGRMIQAVADKIEVASPLTKAELVEVRNLFY